ncbi:unnamed protein product [Adineta steineri]|uniref:BZIP domain-containing protein n=1 Tax=Adineta steineri TaxID=433720 RepID=A0A815EQ59_9BILA|nr:unnamed protein product [Adineta steineri]CAF3924975.1 unnamed protein product [Adineta steineri]
MQTDEGEYEFTASTLDTPSLITPNIVLNPSIYKPTFNSTDTDASTNNANSTISNPASIATTTTTGETSSTEESSADVKVLKIEDELKQNFGEPRRPTPSPFRNISSSNSFTVEKPSNVITNDDGSTIEIPSTADVVKELEALTNTNPFQYPIKALINGNNERETTTAIINSDNIRYDSPPTVNMGVIVSPKKKLLIRSQSHTEPTSPVHNNNNNNNHSQSQKNNNDNSISNTQNSLDDENSTDDSGNHSFTRLSDLSTVTHPSDSNNINNNPQFKSVINNGNEQSLNIQLRMDQNGVSHPLIKQQAQIIMNNVNHNKRPYQLTNTGNHLTPLTKANTLIIPQPSLNEVTSTDLSPNAKRQKGAQMPVNSSSMNFRPSFPSTASGTVTHPLPTTTTNGSNMNAGSEDHRKKQIRDSNREAARRCRERRRQYIEQLEGTLENYKTQIKQLTEKFNRVERENTQLRTILSETKIPYRTSGLSLSEGHVEYRNVIAATAVDLNSESNHQNDGGALSRTYINRNNL